MASVSTSNTHLNGLTGLRFWAAAFVMLYHFNTQLGTIPLISEATRFGTAGVTFFFVLSGFVLAWTYHGVPVSKSVFYWRRFARIWPLHIVTTIISIAAWRLIDSPTGTISFEVLAPAFFLLHAWWSDFLVIRGGSGASWSLSAEAFFYAVFPFLLIGISRIRSLSILIWIPAIMTVFLAVLWLLVPEEGIGNHARATLLAYFPPARLPQFVAGVALGVAMKLGWVPKFGFKLSGTVIVTFFFVMYLWSELVERGTFWYPHNPSQSFSIIPFAMLIVVVAKADLAGMRHVFKGKTIELLGQSSFALYLVHVPMALVWLYLFGKPSSLGMIVVSWCVVSSMAIALSIFLYKAFEKPVERWLRPLVGGHSSRETSKWRIAQET